MSKVRYTVVALVYEKPGESEELMLKLEIEKSSLKEAVDEINKLAQQADFHLGWINAQPVDGSLPAQRIADSQLIAGDQHPPDVKLVCHVTELLSRTSLGVDSAPVRKILREA